MLEASTAKDPRPFVVLTVVLDASARPAAITRSHGDAMERGLRAIDGRQTAGIDLVELTIQPKSFAALRKALSMPPTTVGLYDIFPLAGHLDPEVRTVAGQFLAAEVLWTLEKQGLLGGASLDVKFDLPHGWDSSDPQKCHARLVEAGALELTAEGIETFKSVKAAFDAASSQIPR